MDTGTPLASLCPRKECVMSIETIIRAWKDESFRNSLSDAQRKQLPANPAGLIDLSAAELDAVEGGRPPNCSCTSQNSCPLE